MLRFPTVEFNEDLSALHGSTLESQISYTSHAISYILSLYPPNTKIIVMGHSMGGIVAASLLSHPKISQPRDPPCAVCIEPYQEMVELRVNE
jgi:glycosylphosphatidylinositol deacylase